MGTWDLQTPIRQLPKSDETTSKAHPKRFWIGILGAVTMAVCTVLTLSFRQKLERSKSGKEALSAFDWLR